MNVFVFLMCSVPSHDEVKVFDLFVCLFFHVFCNDTTNALNKIICFIDQNCNTVSAKIKIKKIKKLFFFLLQLQIPKSTFKRASQTITGS